MSGPSADRLDELADTAELMGDESTAARLRDRAHRLRLAEMDRIPPSPTARNER